MTITQIKGILSQTLIWNWTFAELRIVDEMLMFKNVLVYLGLR